MGLLKRKKGTKAEESKADEEFSMPDLAPVETMEPPQHGELPNVDFFLANTPPGMASLTITPMLMKPLFNVPPRILAFRDSLTVRGRDRGRPRGRPRAPPSLIATRAAPGTPHGQPAARAGV